MRRAELEMELAHDLRIKRHHDRNAMATLRQSKRQCAGNIRKTAGLRIRNRFACHP